MADSRSPPSAGRSEEAPRRKRRGKKPAGSRWLNRLLCFGCCISLVPLCLEWYWTQYYSDPFPKPHEDDPWVRVVDATPPERNIDTSGVQKHWRHHPRHGRQRAGVHSDGGVDDQEAEDDEIVEIKMNGSSSMERPIRMPGEPLDLITVLDAKSTLAAAGTVVGTLSNRTAQATLADLRLAAEKVQVSGSSASLSGSASISSSNILHSSAKEQKTAARFAFDEDELRHYFRQVDAGASNSSVQHAGSKGSGAPSRGSQRLFRAVPGGVHDVMALDISGNMSAFSVDHLTLPNTANSTFVVDATGVLDVGVLGYLNRNLSWVERLTPFRVILVVINRQPTDLATRHLYAAQVLRSWYGLNRMYERTLLIVLSLDGLVEVVVGRQVRLVMSDALGRALATKAMELLKGLASEPATTEPSASRELLRDVAQKLTYHICITVRARTQATAMNMRSLSMFMMLFMVMTITATKQQQARRIAELYGHPYGAGVYSRMSPFLSGGQREEAFWDEFEMGRRGGGLVHARQLAVQREQDPVLFRLHVLQMLLSSRVQNDDTDEEYDELDGEEEVELLSATAGFYEEECRCGSVHRS
jgi:uncharacterized membrane protein YgcG